MPMRNRDPHRENVENILAICLPIVAMQYIRESPSASRAMRKSAWNACRVMGESFKNDITDHHFPGPHQVQYS